MKKAVFTIVSRNYTAMARTLLQSFKCVHSDWDRYLLLADELGYGYETYPEEYRVITIKDINLPDFERFTFRYNLLELNTAVKPWMFDWLFSVQGYDRVIYLDPDIYIYGRLDEVEQLLDQGGFMVLTPHLTSSLEDDRHPNELAIMNSGAYNLGFLALAQHGETNKFLKWWQGKLEFDCVVDFSRGLFVDQKWMDLAPGLYNDVHILRHPGYNVAYWNLNDRIVTEEQGKYKVNGQPLVFFHYSGINPTNITNISKHQDRYTIKSVMPAVKNLFEQYASQVLNNGYEHFKKYPYYFEYFTDGTKIDDFMRIIYRQEPYVRQKCGPNPFKYSHVFYIFYNIQVRDEDRETNLPLITYITYHIWKNRADLQNIFPDIFGANRVGFCEWFIAYAERKYAFPMRVIEPVRESLKKYKETRSGKVAYGKKPVVKVFPENNMQQLKKGVNLIGYVRAEMGVGQGCRGNASAMNAAGIPFTIINFEVGNPARMTDLTWKHKETGDAIYNTNLFHVNADQTPVIQEYIDGAIWKNRYNIGHWTWELPEFPDEWCSAFKYFNEIWVPSEFVRESVVKKSPLPVVRMPYPIEDPQVSEQFNRLHFGIPEAKFLFLAMYDVHSVHARKNPGAAIQAFIKAFFGDSQVGLVIKVNNGKSNPYEVQQLQMIARKCNNVFILDKVLSRIEINSLINSVDCFISLHRSEGFGLVIAEAMYLGKPVIATNWSGNVDFMSKKNSCPVNYKLTELTESYGPYKKGQYWAEPDIEHAKYYMQKIFKNNSYRCSIGAEAKEYVRTNLSPLTVGKMIYQRLVDIQRL
jgi:glycosyltransferase involved in cell wall biosynthesis